MKIEILEETGIRHEGLGHMQKGEIRVVPNQLGAFFCANGWARDVDERVETGERGKLDLQNPEGVEPESTERVQPHDMKIPVK